MKKIKLIGRNSRLSLLQLQLVKQRIEAVLEGAEVEIIARSSRGDELKDIPLQTVEGSDFFTADIFNALATGEADIAVHSLKDMSSEHFFGPNRFAVVDRDDTRDVAIFEKSIVEKLEQGREIIIGTCSPRREEMAIGFLQKALPQLSPGFKVVTKIIRGNVDSRLRKLDKGEYDGIILATAGLNRLLKGDENSTVKELLAGKRLMLLPLIECVPAPCQGAIVVEANPGNAWAVSVINQVNNEQLMRNCVNEKKLAVEYGTGCLQKFGVTTFNYGSEIIYAAGTDSNHQPFTRWQGLPALDVTGKTIFSSTDHMGSFFEYDYDQEQAKINEPIVYVANYKAVHTEDQADQLGKKIVWAAGTKTWLELAKKGIWVQGSADAFGLETLAKLWETPLVNVSKEKVAVITNEQSKETWKRKGWNVYSTYSLLNKKSVLIEEQIKKADIIFWTSIRQYEQYKKVVKENVTHVCSYGETAEQLQEADLEPVIFPNIKAFQQWRQTSGLSRNAA